MQLLRRLSFSLLLLSLMTLVACGGSGGDISGGGVTTPDTITLSIAKSDGDLSGDNDVTVGVKVLKGSTPVVNQLVTFVLSNPTLAIFSPEVGTAVTDSEGIAKITLLATNIPGGVEVTASIVDVDPIAISFTSIGGGPGGGTGGNPVADSISLFASSQQIASSGAQSIILTAIAKDGNNNLLEGVKISFAADSGALEKVIGDDGLSSDVTGPDGKVTRKLSTLAEPTNRIITTTVTSGSVSDTLEVEVIGTKINITGSSSLALQDPNNYILKVVDSDGNGLANVSVALSLANTPSDTFADIDLPLTATTDFNGQATISVTGKTGGTNSIIAKSNGASAQQEVAVQADSFLFTNFGDGTNNVNPSNSPLPDILLSKKTTVTLTWLRGSALLPVVDKEVVFTTTRGNLNVSSAKTDINGKVTVEVNSTNAGKALLTFTGSDIDKNIELNNQLEFEFVADSAHRLIAKAYPISIGPNEQTSTISVVVRDNNGNLVKNKTIDFVLDDVSNGSIFPASSVTDSNGTASTVYTSSSTSANNGVTVTATVRGTLSVSDSVSLTVADREVFIALGTGNTILQTDINTYNKQYSVFVTDIDSNPVPNVTLTVSAIPQEYYKGEWVVVLKDGEFSQYAPSYTAKCANEDVNGNGVLDDLADEEDTNTDGQLTPGNLVNAKGTVTTDEDGRAMIDIEYAEVFGFWANIDLIVSTKVNGTESFARALFNLSVAGEDVTNEGNPPATFLWPSGPFGRSNSCFNAL